MMMVMVVQARAQCFAICEIVGTATLWSAALQEIDHRQVEQNICWLEESYSSSVVYSVVIRYCEGWWLEQEKCESMKLLIGNEMVADEVKINIARGR